MARNLVTAATAAAMVTLGFVAPAQAGSKFVIRGAGFGHGVGMSQYGAYGFAQQGANYREILAHYYTGTSLNRIAGTRTVRVLLRSVGAPQKFTGATRAAGRRLQPGRRYGVRPGPGGTVELLSPRGRRMARVAAPLRVTSRLGYVQLSGPALNGRSDGNYRGAMEFRPNALGGVDAINAVSLEDYVRGVVPLESPASWPAEALKAQAVAARTYAITTSKTSGAGWEHYPDVRSQVYGGVAAEVATTDRAVADTAGVVVTYGGEPVVTYFFSTSGGRTENVENSLGGVPQPWLRSVEDPYDDASPRHRWGPMRLTLAQADRKLGSLVPGAFRGIEVVKRGKSPRIMQADVVGTAGRNRVSGATLRARLGLYDTWAYFTTISSSKDRPKPDEPEDDVPAPQAAGDPETGGASPGARAATASRRAHAVVRGRVIPARRGGTVVVQRRDGRSWIEVGTATVRSGGRFREPVSARGRYRVRFGGVTGPTVRIR